MYDAFRSQKEGEFFYFNCARQLGKSYTLSVLALEECLRGPNKEIKYAAPTQKEARSILRPQLRSILRGAPSFLRSSIRFNSMDGVWRFPNGSQLTIGGLDGENFERLRGQFAHAIFVDEAGFVAELEDALLNVLLPQTLTTGGRILVASTPADSAGHYSTELAHNCQSQGNYAKYTIWDADFERKNNPITKDQILAKLRAFGGEKSTRWRREMLCEFVTDIANAVFPSMSEDLAASIIREPQRPDFFDAYTCIDLGYTDATAILFGYYDYEKAILVVEDEWVKARANSQEVMQAVVEKERELWGNKEPLLRVTDVDPRFAADFMALHGMTTRATPKDNLQAAVNRTDVWLAGERIIIHPRCKTLIRQLYNATWNDARTQFKHDRISNERSMCDYHYDAAAALIYLVRNVVEFHNPFPATVFDRKGAWVNSSMIKEMDPYLEKDGGFAESMSGVQLSWMLAGLDDA